VILSSYIYAFNFSTEDHNFIAEFSIGKHIIKSNILYNIFLLVDGQTCEFSRGTLGL